MASIFGDDGIDDLFNDNLAEEQLPSDGEGEPLQEENLFGENNEANDEGGDGQAIKVEPKKRAVRNPRLRLTIDTLRGQRGIQTIEDYYKDIKYQGKGYEKEDLNEIMRRLQHWAHRMYPTYKFDDVLTNIERLGKKKPLQVYMSRYRLGLLENTKTNEAVDEANANDAENDEAADEPFDEFDALLGEQIAISKIAPRTPAQHHQRNKQSLGESLYHSAKSSASGFTTPSFTKGNAVMSTPYSVVGGNRTYNNDISEYAQPLPPSQPATPQLNSEQMARIAENRRLAQERLRAKQQQQQL